MRLRKGTLERKRVGESLRVGAVRGESMQVILDVGGTGGPTELLDAATRELTALLGEAGACVLLGERPRVIGDPSEGSTTERSLGCIETGNVAEAARTGQIVVAVDQATIAVPLSDGDHCFGVVLVSSQRSQHLTQMTRATATVVARLTAVLLRRAAEWHRITPAATEALTSASISTFPPSPPDAAGRVLLVEDDLATAAALAEALEDEGYIVLQAGDGREGVARALSSHPDIVLFDVNLPILDGFAAADQLRAAEVTRDTPIIFLSARPDLSQQVRARRLENVDFLPKPLSGNELLTRVNQAIVAARARYDLQQRAAIDELTGLGNLRMFRARLQQEHERFSRYGNPFSVAMIDVDKLKAINDQKGHLAGSDALRAIADVLRCEARATDLVARYGGDEMVVLLPHTTLGDAFPFAERVRSAVARLTVHGLHPTVSVGVASLNAGSEETDDELLGRADRAAYSAKRAGGNRTFADGEPCAGG